MVVNYNFFSILEVSFYSTFRIIFICFAGYLLVRSKIIDKPTLKGIAEMTANLLIPCLAISEICKSFHISNYEIWLPILIYCVYVVSVGYILGLIIIRFVNNTYPEIERLILITCMFSNATSMQLIYIESLAPLLAVMINGTEIQAKSKGYVIVILFTIFVNFLRWSVGYYLMKPDTQRIICKEYLKDLQLENDTNINMEGRKFSFNDEEAECKTYTCRKEALNSGQNFMKILKETCNMPFVASISAVIITSIPYVNVFFSDPNSLGYKLLTEPCESIGKCVSPMIILILGLNLSLTLDDNNDQSDTPLNKNIILLILFVKAIVFPLIGIVSVWAIAFKTEIIVDPLLCFLILTNFCTPTAINMITIAIINKFQVNNLSKLLIYQYLMGAFTVTIWTAIYMSLFL